MPFLHPRLGHRSSQSESRTASNVLCLVLVSDSLVKVHLEGPENGKTPGDCSPGACFAKVASVFAIIRKTLRSRVLRLTGDRLRWAIPARLDAVFTRHFPDFYTF